MAKKPPGSSQQEDDSPQAKQARKDIAELFRIAMGDRKLDEICEFASNHGHNVSKQYFRLILDERAPTNPTIDKLDVLRFITGIPIQALRDVYKSEDRDRAMAVAMAYLYKTQVGSDPNDDAPIVRTVAQFNLLQKIETEIRETKESMYGLGERLATLDKLIQTLKTNASLDDA